jgi:uncharacterized damage-inducible protein DinB
MTVISEIEYLLDYTEWDRGQWESWFRAQGPEVFALGVGENADGRIQSIGELVRHIFSAEQRYVDRIRELPISDTSSVPPNDVDALFAFGRGTREHLRQLVIEFPADRWDIPREIQIGSNTRVVTPRTMLAQSVTHEIRHWAQIATLLRLAGRKTGPHDFLISGVFERKLAPSGARSIVGT